MGELVELTVVVMSGNIMIVPCGTRHIDL